MYRSGGAGPIAYLIGFVIAGLIAYVVAQDANKRGMNGVLWGIGVFLFCIVFLPLYFIMRKPLVAQSGPMMSNPMGQALRGGSRFCSSCGSASLPGSQFCQQCGRPL